MSIRILKNGLLDTIQDNGRYGCQHLGINPSGAMDINAAAVASILAGNTMDEAVIEMHFPAASIYFEKTCLVALSGADFGACINNEPIPISTTIIIAKGNILSFNKYKSGARIYLAVHGGFAIDKWLNSYSTNIKASAGGYNGRALKKDDVIYCNLSTFAINEMIAASFIVTTITADTVSLYSFSGIIRCIKGNSFQQLHKNSQQLFIQSSFTISMQSDKMGYRLIGEKIEMIEHTEQLSSAVTKGSLQLLPGGSMILLMADHQTTGGYPVIANVISADIPAIAQMQPGATLKFQLVSMEEAEKLYLSQQEYLQLLQQACTLQLNSFFPDVINRS